jgi:hypothetical protein
MHDPRPRVRTLHAMIMMLSVITAAVARVIAVAIRL